VALAAAAAYLPDRAAGQAAVIETVVDAGRLLARAQPGSLKLEPGENWLEYLTAVEPYIEPLVIGPEIIDSSVQMLALATRFPPWAVQSGVVRFVWDGADVDPLLAQMARINSCLYGLNGYTLELARAAEEIGTELPRETIAPAPPALPFRPDEPAIEPPPTGPTFQDLFRKEAP